MSGRIDKNLRDKIRKRGRETPVRVLARELECAPGTIQRWKNRGDAKELPRHPQGPPGLNPFEKAVFREMVRLTGYPRSRLFEYLAPIWKNLPSQARNDSVDDQGPRFRIAPITNDARAKHLHPRTFLQDMKKAGLDDFKILHPRTFHREMKKSELDNFKIERPNDPGSIAVHRVLARWQYTKGDTVDGEILLMMERFSGAIYAKAHIGRVEHKDFVTGLRRFDRMLQVTTFQLNLVTLGREDCFDFGELNAAVIEDPRTSPQSERLTLPTTFDNLYALNCFIKHLVNRINLTDRYYYLRNKKEEMTPYKLFGRLFPAHVGNAGSEKRLKKRMKLLVEKIK